jgi:hypothetical protein
VYNKKLISELTSSLNWALLTFGTFEFTIALTRSWYFLIPTFCCSLLYCIYSVYLFPKVKLYFELLKLILFCASFLILLILLFDYFVLLEISKKVLVVDTSHVTIFFISSAIIGLLLFMIKNESN